VDHSRKLLPSKVTFGRGTIGDRATAMEDLLLFLFFDLRERERRQVLCWAKSKQNSRLQSKLEPSRAGEGRPKSKQQVDRIVTEADGAWRTARAGSSRACSMWCGERRAQGTRTMGVEARGRRDERRPSRCAWVTRRRRPSQGTQAEPMGGACLGHGAATGAALVPRRRRAKLSAPGSTGEIRKP
jgi:hypothetical protein